MLNKCFGIISWLPDEEINRRERQLRLNRLITQLDSIWPDIDILIIAQNWKNFTPVRKQNKQIIKYYNPLGILGARKALRKEFLELNYDYIIMFDDDAIIEFTNKNSPKEYLEKIDSNPKGFSFVRGKNNPYNPYAGAQLNLCAISRYIYEKEDMVDIDPQKGEGFEDCIFATLLHYKYSNLEWLMPEDLKCIQFGITGEKAKSTWWDTCRFRKGMLKRNNAICKYISEKKKLPPDLKQFLKNYGSTNYKIEKVIVPKAEAFTGLTEEWWKEDF